MILSRAFYIAVLLIGMSCKKEDTALVENVTVELPEKVEFSPSGEMPAKPAAILNVPILNNQVSLPPVTLPKLDDNKSKEFGLPKKSLSVEQNVLFRDPFLSYLGSASDQEIRQIKDAALLDFDIKNYKYVGFLLQGSTALALIEDSSGMGYTVKIGSKIGKNAGRVESVHPNEIVIKEERQDGTGKGQSSYTTLKLAH